MELKLETREDGRILLTSVAGVIGGSDLQEVDRALIAHLDTLTMPVFAIFDASGVTRAAVDILYMRALNFLDHPMVYPERVVCGSPATVRMIASLLDKVLRIKSSHFVETYEDAVAYAHRYLAQQEAS
jgi:hypothetical protein